MNEQIIDNIALVTSGLGTVILSYCIMLLWSDPVGKDIILLILGACFVMGCVISFSYLRLK